MNFIDFIILLIVVIVLGTIIYFKFIKKEDMCRKCPYKKDSCNIKEKCNKFKRI